MRRAELLLKELATLVDIDLVNIVIQDMEYDEARSLCRSLLRRLGDRDGRLILIKLARRIDSPDLRSEVLRALGGGET
jgi:hypothetical protein